MAKHSLCSLFFLINVLTGYAMQNIEYRSTINNAWQGTLLLQAVLQSSTQSLISASVRVPTLSYDDFVQQAIVFASSGRCYMPTAKLPQLVQCYCYCKRPQRYFNESQHQQYAHYFWGAVLKDLREHNWAMIRIPRKTGLPQCLRGTLYTQIKAMQVLNDKEYLITL